MAAGMVETYEMAATPAEIAGGNPTPAIATRVKDSLMEMEQPDVILAITDVIRDVNGEVVIFNDSQFRTLEITTDAAVLSEGTTSYHVTIGGDDVSGFRFISFADGLKLFYDNSLTVTVRQVEG